MLSSQLEKLRIQLEEGKNNIDLDNRKLLAELNELAAIEEPLQESLSLSKGICPTCGRRL